MKRLLLILLLLPCIVFAQDSEWTKVDGLTGPSSIVDSSGSVIDPASEATLSTIAGDTTSMDGKMPSDPSTVTEQDQLQALIGEVQATPTENTVLDRLKDIWDRLLDKTAFFKITDGTDDMTVNEEGRADVVQHAHPNSGTIHFFATGLVADQDFILIDISDTTNYPHTETGYIHIEWINFQVLGTTAVAAEYQVGIGFLEDVDATSGDFYHVEHIDGSRTLGTSQTLSYVPYPNAFRCRTESHTTGHKSLNDVAFQTDVNLASTLNPTSVDTPSGSGDFIGRIDWTAGTIDVIVTIGYHTHTL